MSKNPEKISRRMFLSDSGKLIGLGVIAHFTLIGRANAFDGPMRTICRRNEDNSCDPKTPGGYSCKTIGSHACAPGGIFECNENANRCTLASGHHE